MAENGYRESYVGDICWRHKAFGVASLLRKVIVGKEASRFRPVSRVGGRAVENERSASALHAHTSQREAGKHASLCEAMRSSRSVIYTPEALQFLVAPHIWLASSRTTFSV